MKTFKQFLNEKSSFEKTRILPYVANVAGLFRAEYKSLDKLHSRPYMRDAIAVHIKNLKSLEKKVTKSTDKLVKAFVDAEPGGRLGFERVDNADLEPSPYYDAPKFRQYEHNNYRYNTFEGAVVDTNRYISRYLSKLSDKKAEGVIKIFRKYNTEIEKYSIEFVKILDAAEKTYVNTTGNILKTQALDDADYKKIKQTYIAAMEKQKRELIDSLKEIVEINANHAIRWMKTGDWSSDVDEDLSMRVGKFQRLLGDVSRGIGKTYTSKTNIKSNLPKILSFINTEAK